MTTRSKPVRNAAFLAVSVLLSACATDGLFGKAEVPAPVEDASVREARAAEAAMQGWRECRDDALALDAQGRATGDSAKYLAAARLFGKCEKEVGESLMGSAVDERMRALALSVQDNLKGGDVSAAKSALVEFEEKFPGLDLYYADGSSFIDSYSLLLESARDGSGGDIAVMNASPAVKSEVRRMRFWQRN